MNKYSIILIFGCLLVSCDQAEETPDVGERSKRIAPPSYEGEFHRSRSRRKLAEIEKSADELRALRKSSLKKYFDKSKTKSATIADLSLAWDLHWLASFDETLLSVNTNSEGYDGKFLPEEFFSMLQSLERKSLYKQIQENDCDFVNDAEEMETFRVLYALYGGSVHAGRISDLALLLSKRSEQIPPSKGDIMVSAIASETLNLADKIVPIDDKQLAAWKLLSKSPNAVYRYLAIQSTQIFMLDDQQKYEIYKMFLTESDKVIVKKVAAKMQGSQSTKILGLKKAFQQKYADEEDLEMMKIFASD